MSEAAALKKPKSGVKLSAAVARSLREGTLVIVRRALALMLFLSFITYQRDDPSFANTGEPGPVGNWIGPIGAWLAGFFFFLFGRPAYLFPIMLGYAGWLVHKNQSLPDARSRINTLLRAAGFVLTLLHELRSCDPALGRPGASQHRRRRARRSGRAAAARGA